MLQVSELYIYPIKSLGGIQLKSCVVTDRGLKYDRRWMLIDETNRFLSQRECAKMALLTTRISGETLIVTNTLNNTAIEIPLSFKDQPAITVNIWDDFCQAQLANDEINRWFTQALNTNARLVYMADDIKRLVDADYASVSEVTSFSDAFPFLLIGQASLDDLNSRLNDNLSINRFRPNIVFTGAAPHFEDLMDQFTINNITFRGAKLCARCNVITINQSNAISGKEPTKTLATYRTKNRKIYFGQNLLHKGTGSINVGDEIKVISMHTHERFVINSK